MLKLSLAQISFPLGVAVITVGLLNDRINAVTWYVTSPVISTLLLDLLMHSGLQVSCQSINSKLMVAYASPNRFRGHHKRRQESYSTFLPCHTGYGNLRSCQCFHAFRTS